MSLLDGTNGPTLNVQLQLTPGTWTTVPITDVRSISIRRGRERPDQRNDAGTVTIVFDNRSGDYDPDKTTGTYWPKLNDGLRVLVSASWQGVTTLLYVGYVESIDADYGFDATSTFTCVDGMARLAKAFAKGLPKAAFDNETTSTRVNRMLTLAKWPTGSSWRDVTGTVRLVATRQDAPVLDIIQECVVAEAGAFFANRTGGMTFQPLTYKFSRPTQLELSDQRQTNMVEYDEIIATPGALQVVNQAVVTSGRKTQYVSTFTESVNTYGLAKVEVKTPIRTADNARKMARYLARKDAGMSSAGGVVFAKPQMYVKSVSFEAAGLQSNLWDDLLTTELQDQLIIRRTTVDGREVILYVVAEGINHDITPDSWRVTFSTSPMNPYRVILAN
jgi:hypothetical protein